MDLDRTCGLASTEVERPTGAGHQSTWPRLATRLAAILVAILQPQQSDGTTRIVPTSFPTIQGAITASASGDTVLVLPGTYLENVWIDRSITVRSQGTPSVTVIDGGSPPNPDHGSTVRIDGGEIDGFDIRNGSGWWDPQLSGRWGGGVYITAQCVIKNNWIHDNHLRPQPGYGQGAFGAAVAMRPGADAELLANRIYRNIVESGNGEVIRAAGTAITRLDGNEIFDNHTLDYPVLACREANVTRNIIACNSSQRSMIADIGGVLDNNTIVANWSDALQPAVVASTYDDLLCILRSNNITHNVGPGIRCYQPIGPLTEFVLECNNIALNGPGGQIIGACADAIGQHGNISVDPEYGRGSGCPSAHGDWCLGPDSPLLEANSPPGCGLIGAVGDCPQIGLPSVDRGAPMMSWALPARPNPFGARTVIPFHLGEEGEVQVVIYGLLGRQVRRLDLGSLGRGDHEVIWDGRDASGVRGAAGAYVAAIRTPRHELTRILLLLP